MPAAKKAVWLQCVAVARSVKEEDEKTLESGGLTLAMREKEPEFREFLEQLGHSVPRFLPRYFFERGLS